MRRRTAILATSVMLAFGGATAVGVGVSHAGEDCGGLDQALKNNLNFIADQQRNPDALSAARIQNRQDVVNLIQKRRADAGCTANVTADAPAAPAAPATTAAAAPAAPAPAPAAGTGAGQVVCPGSTVTLDGQDGAPSASSNQFPAGTTLKVTNLDNNQSITVQVSGPSGSCILLNNTAFNQIHEPGKNLIRRAVIEKIG
jgi:hypothetical protein